MSKNKNIRWLLGTLGILSTAFSLVMLFTTTVLAACSAQATNCPEIKCELSGAGTCSATSRCVSCTPAGQEAGLPLCCMGGEGD